MSLHELGNIKGKDFFQPESKEVEALQVFNRLKATMEALGWVYEGSLRWTKRARLMRVVYTPHEDAVMELCHTNGDSNLMRRIGTDCNENGLDDALMELHIT